MNHRLHRLHRSREFKSAKSAKPAVPFVRGRGLERMSDSRTSLSHQARSLAKLLSEQSLPQHVWTEEEIGAVLVHQWMAPLRVSLEGISPQQRSAVKLVAEADELLLRSFGDLLTHRSPPLELLVIMKDFAKAVGVHPHSPLPPDAARVMYLGAIAAARVRCRQRISSMTDAELIEGMRWTLAQRWLAPQIESVLEDLLVELEGKQEVMPT